MEMTSCLRSMPRFQFYDNIQGQAYMVQQCKLVPGSLISLQTITAQYNNTVGDPLQETTGTWNITSTSATKGGFAQTKKSVAYTMELP